MTKRATHGRALTPAERRWAAADTLLGGVLLALGAAAAVLPVIAIVSARRQGDPVHPDSILFPLFAAVPLLGFGALFRVAARTMRRGVPARWTVQWMVVLMPLILACFILLSLL
jgi:hypothetical protein